jgi:hypothetical protein
VDVRLSLPRLLDAVEREGDPSRPSLPNDPRALRLEMEKFMRRAAQAIQQSGAASPEEAEAVLERLASTPPDASPATPASPEEDAQRLAYDALVARGRYQLQLARRALARWPDCADGWLVLGNRAKTPAEAIDCYEQAVAAGERAHGPEPFERDAGHLWSTVDARPYLRAKLALADALDAADRADDAIGHYRDIVRLDRDDHLGARFPLLQILLRRSKDDEAQALIEQFAEDEGAEWLYSGALVAYRREAADAADRLRRALADALDAAERADDAIGHYRDIVRLDRDDHLGARVPLLQILLRRSQADEAPALIEQFAEDEGAVWLYGGAREA